jgi:hypothetical protein
MIFIVQALELHVTGSEPASVSRSPNVIHQPTAQHPSLRTEADLVAVPYQNCQANSI